MIDMARNIAEKEDFEQALAIIFETEKLVMENFEKVSVLYGLCCYHRGLINYERGNYLEAEKSLLEAKSIWETTVGKNTRKYAACLNNLGNVYSDMGDYKKSESFYLDALAIRAKVLGKEHQDYAACLSNVGLLYADLGDYEKAKPYYLEASRIHEKTLGKEDLLYATSQFNLGILYLNICDYGNAEQCFMQAKAIWEKKLGKGHSIYATCLNSFANLYSEMGDYHKAEQYYLEAKDIREKTLGKEHQVYLVSLDNLGNLYGTLGDFKKKEAYHLEAKQICEKSLGKDHPVYASIIYNLGYAYVNLGNYEEAESLFIEAKNIWAKTMGVEHPNYANSLNGLGTLYMHLGDFDKAEACHLEAKAILEKVAGKEHIAYLLSLNYLSSLYEKKSRFEESEAMLTEHFSVTRQQLLRSVTFLSEKELAKYAVSFEQKGNELVGLLYDRTRKGKVVGELPSLCYDLGLFQKGFLLGASIRLSTLATSSSEAEEINARLKSFRRRLASEYSLPVSERKYVLELEEKVNAEEKALARTVAGYSDAMRQVSWAEVQHALKPGETAIEFLRFRLQEKNHDDSIMYAALVLKHGDSRPTFIPLFEEKQLDSILMTNGKERKADYVNDLYALNDRGVLEIGKPKKMLYNLIWQPLEKEFAQIASNGGSVSVYFSPAGLLHRINFAAIPLGNDLVLGDRYNLIQLNSTRQITGHSESRNITNDAMLIGGIQFDPDSAIMTEKSIADLAIRSRGLDDFNFNQTDVSFRANYPMPKMELQEHSEPTFIKNAQNQHQEVGPSGIASRGSTWTYLPGTEKEIFDLQRTLSRVGYTVGLKKGVEATEEFFKEIGASPNSSPRILHIATHGYFFPDKKTTGIESAFKASDNPLIRSGLILAGGNHAWLTGKPFHSGMEDGILTAFEIAQMNLSNTELVVLSACETGLGDIQGNEGVYGLQRAFKIAGVKYIIMSLWQVPDKQTSMLMTTFYKKWLEAEGPDKGGKKMSIPDAFHAAQKELRELGFDPYQWAGFVLIE